MIFIMTTNHQRSFKQTILFFTLFDARAYKNSNNIPSDYAFEFEKYTFSIIKRKCGMVMQQRISSDSMKTSPQQIIEFFPQQIKKDI